MFGIDRDMVFTFIMRVMVLLTAMPVHECAHGLVAVRLGDDTPEKQGRLTLNPFAHLDLIGSILLVFTGFGWAKPVQVDMRNFKKPRRDMALTSLAGPVSNLIMSLLVMILLKLLLGFLPMMRTYVSMNSLARLFNTAILINISLALFNFLPIPPLDGSKIIGVFLPEKLYWGMLRYQQQIAIVVMILLFTNVLTIPLSGLAWAVYDGLDVITRPIDMLFR